VAVVSQDEIDVTETFENADAGASGTVPIQAGNLKKGSFVVIKGFPCKVRTPVGGAARSSGNVGCVQIIETSISKTGKHGHAKIHMVALDIFTGKKMEDISPTSHNMTQPVVTRQDFQLLNVDDEDFCSLMNDRSETKVRSLQPTLHAATCGRDLLLISGHGPQPSRDSS
jgi:translation initiation factor 5A